MGVLVGEYPDTTIFRLNRVFTNPIAASPNLDTTGQVETWASNPI